MTAFALVLTGILAVVAVTVVPRRAMANVEALRRLLPTDPTARVRMYRRFLLSGALLTAIAAVVVAVGGEGFRQAGLTWSLAATDRVVPVTALGLAGFLVVMVVASRLVRREGEPKALVLLPRSAEERRLWPAVAFMAGLSEEAVYRGLFILHLHALVPSLRPAFLAVGAAALFALGHRYQGPIGIVGSGALGLVFGAVAVATESLLAPIVLHGTWDLVVGYAGLRSYQRAERDVEAQGGADRVDDLGDHPVAADEDQGGR